MNYHIVRANETIDKIANSYNLLKEEIIEINMHITNWDHLIPGTRLKLPEIPDVLKDELDAVEPFIEDYYPKIDVNKFKENAVYQVDNNVHHEEEVLKAETVTTNVESNVEDVKTRKQKQSYKPYPCGFYYPYYPYFYNNKRKNGKFRGKG